MKAKNAARHLLLPVLVDLTVLSGLAVAAGSSHALTLGNLRGAAFVGRTVSVTVPVQFDASERAADVCAEVEIFFADNRVLAGRVRSGWQAPDATKEGVLRIETTSVVDEPVVSIQVTAGCVRKASRKYILLADIPAESSKDSALGLPLVATGNGGRLSGDTVAERAPVTAAEGFPSDPVVSADRSSQSGKARGDAQRNARGTRAEHSVPKPSATKAVPVLAPVPTAVAKDVAKDESKPVPRPLRDNRPDSRARLKLDTVTEVNPALKSTLELLTAPAEADQAREDAKTLWRSLNAQPDELLRDAKRLQALEAQVKSLQQASSKNQQAQEALKTQLSQAETERYVNPLVGGLAAVLLCVLGGGAYLFFRMRRGRFGSEKDWWRSQSSEPSILSDLAPATGPVARNSVRGKDSKNGRDSRSGRTSRSSAADQPVDDSLFDSLRARAATASRAEPRRVAAVDSVPPRSGFFHSSMGARAVNVEELFDVQQQAEFFVSLGQHEQAIDLLQQHIYGATSTSGLAYLDLLQLYHQFNRREEFDQLREEFNRLFHAHVPVFEKYTSQQSRGIARYTDAMSRIEQAWNTPQVMEVLQDLIFRSSGDSRSEAFDLMAYRELMLLFSIAKDLAESSPGVTYAGHEAAGLSPATWAPAKSSTPSASRSAVSPPLDLSLESAAQLTPLPTVNASPRVSLDDLKLDESSRLPEVSLPKPSPRLGLDVDLFELESEMAPLPEPPPGQLADDHLLDFSLSLPAEMPPSAQAAPLPTLSPTVGHIDLSNFFSEHEAVPLKPAVSELPFLPSKPG